MADATGFLVPSPHPGGEPGRWRAAGACELSRRLLTDQAEALDAEQEPAHGRDRGQPAAAPSPPCGRWDVWPYVWVAVGRSQPGVWPT
jgi:hypothetical protein